MKLFIHLTYPRAEITVLKQHIFFKSKNINY